MKTPAAVSGNIITLLLVIVIIFSAGFTLASQVKPAAAGNSGDGPLLFYEKEYDFGEILQGDKVTHTFGFRNVGDRPITLSRVSASCGCTATSGTRGEIAPGAEGEVTATFNSTGRRGKQKKAVYVETGGIKDIAKMKKFIEQVRKLDAD